MLSYKFNVHIESEVLLIIKKRLGAKVTKQTNPLAHLKQKGCQKNYVVLRIHLFRFYPESLLSKKDVRNKNFIEF